MDYLHAFPPELWRKVLRMVRFGHYWSALDERTSAGSLFLCYLYGDGTERDLHKIQANFSRLLTVCKSLYPLVEEALWSTIHLISHRMIDGSFEEVALGVGSLGRSRGERTQELWLAFKDSGEFTGTYGRASYWKIHAMCPNLQSYILFGPEQLSIPIYPHILLQQNEQAANWAAKITSLSIMLRNVEKTDVECLAKSFTSLNSLAIWSISWDQRLLDTFTFPLLRRLSIYDCEESVDYILSAIKAPQLQFLYVDYLTGPEICKFLSSTKHTLLSLSIYDSPFQSSFPDRMTYITVLDALPRLQTLVASAFYDTYATIHPELLSREGTVFPLEELVLRVGTFLNQESPHRLEEFSSFLLNYFPTNWFPHLKRLVLKTSTTREDMNYAALIAAAKVGMPRAEVEWLELVEGA